MRTFSHNASVRHAQRGAGLVDVLAGLLIGLVSTVIMLAVFAGTEGLKRNAVGVADAQHTALLALTTLGADLANAGNTYASAAIDLDLCPETGDIATTLRPIPVLITAGATDNAPDSFVVASGAPSASAAPMPLAADAPPGSPFRVKSPLGFATGDAVVAIGPDGRCALANVSTVSAPDSEGVVTVAHAGATESWPETTTLLDLGPRSRMQRVRYDIVEGTLRSLDLTTAGATPNPLASNIVNMKLQYGVDDDNDGTIDHWIGAGAPPWDPASVLAAPAAALARIKAVRIGLVVKSDAYDRDVSARQTWTLFDCGGDGACPGHLTGTLPAKWRYRSYEIVVALRNAVWNARP